MFSNGSCCWIGGAFGTSSSSNFLYMVNLLVASVLSVEGEDGVGYVGEDGGATRRGEGRRG